MFYIFFQTKNPENRARSTELLDHDFIKRALHPSTLVAMINEAKEVRENLQNGIYPTKIPAPLLDKNGFEVSNKPMHIISSD